MPPSLIEQLGNLNRSVGVRRFERNALGRDFVVGDIHGMFPHLRALLTQVNFDQNTDRLFSVGDLVDRGPRSDEALDWLDFPWFFACRGNHEQFAIQSIDPEDLQLWVQYNGGAWWLDVPPEDQPRFRDAFLRLPLAMEVDTETGTVGIVHADVPPMISWDRFAELLESGDEDAEFYAMWSRNRISGNCPSPVQGSAERIYCGHTPTRETVQVSNVNYIDTGAAYCFEGHKNARLTLVEIQPSRHREYQINTNKAV